MSKTRRIQNQPTEAELRLTVQALPGEWDVKAVQGQHIRLRWLAWRDQPETDDDGVVSAARQFESWVDADDLIEGIHRRNVALGIETRATREEVARSA